jgi:glycosyltransferase involved in cell wall biosynthesis
MNIAWMTPFFRDSAVGELAGRAALELQNSGHNVVLFGTGGAPYIPTPLRFVELGQQGRVDPDVMNQFDAVVYNVANHGSSFPIFWLLERTPGIVILCDRVYVHGLDAYTQQTGAPNRLEAMAQRCYGPEGVAFVQRFRSGRATPEDFERFTFIEPLLRFAQCAVVHSNEYRELVASRWNGPVERLTGFTLPPRPAATPPPREAFTIGPDDFLLAFVGYITPHRSLQLLFEVLRDRPDLAARVKVAIVGRIEDQAYAQTLQQTAAQFGLASIMRWGFNAPDEVKHAMLSHADAAYNCRSLNSEGSSASLLEEMSYGLPVIVNANGFARDIPADAVCFVQREQMRRDVERTLEALIANPQERRAIGQRAKAYVAKSSSTQTYANVIERIAEQTAGTRPVNSVKGRVYSVLEEMGVVDGGTLEANLYTDVETLLAPVPAPRETLEPPSPKPATRSTRALFVRGCPRSGTTLLADILNEHPQIGLLVEYPFGMLVRQLLPVLWYEDHVKGEIAKAHETARQLQTGQTPAATGEFFVPLENKEHVQFARRYPTRETFPAVVRSVVEASLEKPGLALVGSKTPGRWDTNDLGLVSAVFGAPKLVFVVRNPRETINSILNRRNFARAGNDFWQFESAQQAIEAYHEATCQLLSCASASPNETFVVGYEELIADPAATLAQLGAFLGVDLDDRAGLVKEAKHGKSVLTAPEEHAVESAFGTAMAIWPSKALTGPGAQAAAMLGDCVATLVPGLEYRMHGPQRSRGMLGAGWSDAAEEGVWSDDNVADLFFSLPPGRYTFTLEFAGYVPTPTSPPIECTLFFDDGPSYTFTLRDLRSVRGAFGPIDVTGSQAHRLSFRFSTLRSPADQGHGNDMRRLGLCLRGIRADITENTPS